jgi:hypothetical protein
MSGQPLSGNAAGGCKEFLCLCVSLSLFLETMGVLIFLEKMGVLIFPLGHRKMGVLIFP